MNIGTKVNLCKECKGIPEITILLHKATKFQIFTWGNRKIRKTPEVECLIKCRSCSFEVSKIQAITDEWQYKVKSEYVTMTAVELWNTEPYKMPDFVADALQNDVMRPTRSNLEKPNKSSHIGLNSMKLGR